MQFQNRVLSIAALLALSACATSETSTPIVDSLALGSIPMDRDRTPATLESACNKGDKHACWDLAVEDYRDGNDRRLANFCSQEDVDCRLNKKAFPPTKAAMVRKQKPVWESTRATIEDSKRIEISVSSYKN